MTGRIIRKGYSVTNSVRAFRNMAYRLGRQAAVSDMNQSMPYEEITRTFATELFPDWCRADFDKGYCDMVSIESLRDKVSDDEVECQKDRMENELGEEGPPNFEFSTRGSLFGVANIRIDCDRTLKFVRSASPSVIYGVILGALKYYASNMYGDTEDEADEDTGSCEQALLATECVQEYDFRVMASGDGGDKQYTTVEIDKDSTDQYEVNGVLLLGKTLYRLYCEFGSNMVNLEPSILRVFANIMEENE